MRKPPAVVCRYCRQRPGRRPTYLWLPEDLPICDECEELERHLVIVDGLPTAGGSVWSEEDGEFY